MSETCFQVIKGLLFWIIFSGCIYYKLSQLAKSLWYPGYFLFFPLFFGGNLAAKKLV